MNSKNSILSVVATGLICAAGISPCAAELPMIQNGDSLGYFITIQNNSFKFGITPDGKGEISVTSKKGDPIGGKLKVAFDFQVEQIMPDGKVSRCAILPETLESTQPAAADPKQTVIRGKVKGDASFEITVEKSRGGLLAGGRVVDPGTLTANPLRFSISLKIPNVYEDAKKGGDKKETKEQDSKRKDDGIELVMADRKKVKVSTSESIDASTKEFNGPGIMAAEISLSSYQGKTFDLAASPNSSMAFSNNKAGPLHEGFRVTWTADTAKDPNGTARMSIAMK